MAINKNHEFEELDGVKCAIVEKNVSKERADFLKQLLEFNKYTVVVVVAAPPKPAPAAKPAAPKPAAAATDTAAATTTETTNATVADKQVANTGAAKTGTATADNTTSTTVESPAVEPPPPPPSLFTIGVTDVTFNPTNAIFGRLLKTPGGRIVTLAFWQQKEPVSNDEVPYFAKK
jgi:hypothetical protein